MTVLVSDPAITTVRHSRLRAPLAIGLAAFAISIAFAWQPSVWFDEAATISAATRSWPQLFEMLRTIDLVHGAYYALMHVWFDLVGYTPFSLRFPSAIATGIAAASVVVLMRMLLGSRTAIVAGIAFCLLPRVTWMGTEGRSYAITVMLATLSTLVFVLAWRSARPGRWWVAYAALSILSSFVFLYLALLVVAHGVTVGLTLWGSRRSITRQTVIRAVGWAIAASITAGVALPFARLVSAQSNQISWIKPIGGGTFWGVFTSQWFNTNGWFASVAWVLIVGGIVLLVRRRIRSPGESTVSGVACLTPAMVLVPWLVVPTLGLIGVSLVLEPLYSARYVAFGAPAAAGLIAVTIVALRQRRRMIAVLVLLAAVALPTAIAQRLPEAKQQSSWSEVAAFIGSERAQDDSGVPEAIVWGPLRQHRIATSRVIEYAYPQSFAGLIDVKLKTPAAETGRLWETTYPLSQVTPRFDGVDVVWLVTSDKMDWRPSVTAKLAALGYHADGEWAFTGTNVLRFRK